MEDWELRGNEHLAKLYPDTCCFASKDWYLGGKGGPSIQKQLLQQRRPHFTYHLWGIMQVSMKSVAGLGTVTASYGNSSRAISVAGKAGGTCQAVPALPAILKVVPRVKPPLAPKRHFCSSPFWLTHQIRAGEVLAKTMGRQN